MRRILRKYFTQAHAQGLAASHSEQGDRLWIFNWHANEAPAHFLPDPGRGAFSNKPWRNCFTQAYIRKTFAKHSGVSLIVCQHPWI